MYIIHICTYVFTYNDPHCYRRNIMVVAQPIIVPNLTLLSAQYLIPIIHVLSHPSYVRAHCPPNGAPLAYLDLLLSAP